MARCPDCNKFVSYEGDEEPEVQNLEIDEDGQITATVRIVKNCGECGTTLKSAELEMSATVDEVDSEWLEENPLGKDEDYQIKETSVEQFEEGGGRYAKSYYGANLTVEVKAPNGETIEVELSDKIAASYMDDEV